MLIFTKLRSISIHTPFSRYHSPATHLPTTLPDGWIPASPGPTVRPPHIRARIGPGFPPGPVPAARFRKNAAIIRVPGGVFTSERVRQYLAAFGWPIFSRVASGTWRSKEGSFLGGPIRAGGHTVRHTVFSDGGLPGRGGLAGKNVQKMLHFYTVF